MEKRVLYVATIKDFIMLFNLPFLKMCKEEGWKTAVAANSSFEINKGCMIPHCDEFFDIPFARNPFHPRNIPAYFKLKKIIQEGKYDIIHCHTPVGGILTRLAARKVRKTGTKVIYTAHGFHFFKGGPLKNWVMFYPIEWLAAHLTDVLITINQEDYALAKKHMHAKEIVYTPSVGLNTERLRAMEPDLSLRSKLGIPEDAFVVLSVGEVNKNKNHQVGIKALAQINRSDIYYVVCGNGPLIEQNRELAQKLDVGDRVHFVGYHNNVGAFYQIADAFLFPSLREGFGMAAAEATYFGVPVIASKVRGVTDFCRDGESGLCFEPTDVAMIAKHIMTLYADRQKGAIFAQKAKMELAGYDVEIVKQKISELYQEPLFV